MPTDELIGKRIQELRIQREMTQEALAEKIANLPLSFTVKTTAEGKIFGSVTSADVAEALAAKGVEVDKKDITLDTIKELGTYEASIRLHREVKAPVSITVVAEGAEATEEAAE